MLIVLLQLLLVCSSRLEPNENDDVVFDDEAAEAASALLRGASEAPADEGAGAARRLALPVLALATAAPGSWPAPGSAVCGWHDCGDIRAHIELRASDVDASGTTRVQVWWRRRDPRPYNKALLIVDVARNEPCAIISAVVEEDCGVVSFRAAESGGVAPAKGVGRAPPPPPPPRIYHLYFLPHRQSGGDASLRFSWLGCDDQRGTAENDCVYTRQAGAEADAARGRRGADSMCGALDAAAAARVLRLENRDAFNAFSEMETMATRNETRATLAALAALPGGAPFVGVFPEAHDRSVRVLGDAGGGRIPARWALGGDGPQPTAAPSLSVSAAPGQWLALQLGLWAYAGAVSRVRAAPASNFVASGSDGGAGGGAAVVIRAIPGSAFTVLNLGGVGHDGAPFVNADYCLAPGAIGALWCGVAVPLDAVDGVTYRGSFLLSAAGAAAPIRVSIAIAVSGTPLAHSGAGNISSMARLAWLNSERGTEDSVPAPFIAVSALSVGGGGRRSDHASAGGSSGVHAAAAPAFASLVLSSLGKLITLEGDGLPSSVLVTHARVRRGAAAPLSTELLAGRVALELFSGSRAVPGRAALLASAALTARRKASVRWSAAWLVDAPSRAAPAGAALVILSATYDFTAVASFNITIANAADAPAAPLALDDVRLSIPLSEGARGWMSGMDEAEGGNPMRFQARTWRWSAASGASRLWIGRPSGGLLLSLKGDGAAWDSPMFGADYAVIPGVPRSWGGADAAPLRNAHGVNVSASGIITAFSGPRQLAPGDAVSFLFDLQLTPSKPVAWAKHWATRTLQVGYGMGYASPSEARALGASVVTLHQGTPGIVELETLRLSLDTPEARGRLPPGTSLVNPYINYVFLPNTVPLLTRYVAAADALGLATKFYYTIRELSCRAPELFALLALQGEVLLDQDPYTIVQPGYAHEWDTHGGSVFMQAHLGNRYGACWQQYLSDGETDPAVCTRGVSRLFNYYVEGLAWSFSQPPHINGIYFDQMNFPRSAMIRIRRAVDAATAAAGRRPALLDLHAGGGGVGSLAFTSHAPLLDYVWNGEGMRYSGGAAVWLVEISGLIHGLTGDTLGAGPAHTFRGLTLGMTQRNSAEARAIWRFWDAARISAAEALYGWWENSVADGPRAVVARAGSARERAGEPRQQSLQEREDGGSSGGDGGECALATTFAAYQSHAIVVVANFCETTVRAALTIDWAELGLNHATTRAALPDIEGVQSGRSRVDAEAPFSLDPNGGRIFLLEAAAAPRRRVQKVAPV